jgi:hypothetical protein
VAIGVTVGTAPFSPAFATAFSSSILAGASTGSGGGEAGGVLSVALVSLLAVVAWEGGYSGRKGTAKKRSMMSLTSADKMSAATKGNLSCQSHIPLVSALVITSHWRFNHNVLQQLAHLLCGEAMRSRRDIQLNEFGVAVAGFRDNVLFVEQFFKCALRVVQQLLETLGSPREAPIPIPGRLSYLSRLPPIIWFSLIINIAMIWCSA